MRIVLPFCFFMLTLSVAAQEVKFTFDKKAILLGEPMQVTMQSFVVSGQPTDFFILDTLPHFEILSKSKIDSVTGSGMLRLTQSFTITSWDSGQWTLPTVIKNGKAQKPFSIAVNYTSPWDSRQPYHDIKGIISVRHPGKSTWWWYVIGAAVLVALFLLFFPEGKKEKPAIQLDSHAYKKAMQHLVELQKKLPDISNKQFHTELVNIFRTYLKGAKGIQSFSKTTDDLAVQLQKIALTPAAQIALIQNLRMSDLVKFARYNPPADANKAALDNIQETITIINQGHAV